REGAKRRSLRRPRKHALDVRLRRHAGRTSCRSAAAIHGRRTAAEGAHRGRTPATSARNPRAASALARTPDTLPRTHAASARTPAASARTSLVGAWVARRRASVAVAAAEQLGLELVLVQELVALRAVALREPRGLRDVAFGHLEQMREVLELDAVARLRERQELLLLAAQRALHERRRDQRCGREHDALVDDVAELADVARPGRRHHQLHRLL